MGQCACSGRNNNEGQTADRSLEELEELRSELMSGSINVRVFTYNELVIVTGNFNVESLIGGGSYGPVYKGKLEENDQLVAVKTLNPDGPQGNTEFITEVRMLSRLRHPNIINLIGCCIEDPHRILVYEFMPLGSLRDHLHYYRQRTAEKAPLDWNTRVEIAQELIKALDYLHHEAQPPVIHRDIRPDNILLGKDFRPIITDFGIARLVPDEANSMRVVYTTKNDVFDYGVVLLELLTGRLAMDSRRERHYLQHWVDFMLKENNDDYESLADPTLNDKFQPDVFTELMKVGLRCTERDLDTRPTTKNVVQAVERHTSNVIKRKVPVGEGTSGG